MALYGYKCSSCGKERDVFIPMNNTKEPIGCSCGGKMLRIFSPPLRINIPVKHKDILVNALNKDDGFDIPARPEHRPRMEKALARGLDYEKPVVGRGF